MDRGQQSANPVVPKLGVSNTDAPGPSCQAGQSASLVRDWMQMGLEIGFAEEVVRKAIKDNGDERLETFVHLLITYQAERNRHNLTQVIDVSSDDDDVPQTKDNSYGGRNNRRFMDGQAQGSSTHADAIYGPPYFYYENSSHAKKGVWTTIREHLYGIEPEFVDAADFCASTRKRFCIHNLPAKKRSRLIPEQPRTIQEKFPQFGRWWPSWDTRKQFNTIQTQYAGAGLCLGIFRTLAATSNPPPLEIKNEVIRLCRKWNLVWASKNMVAELEPTEVESLLGFPEHHTRCRDVAERYHGLGSAFQVDAVAYFLSVLKGMYPHGIKVLSLFSGIGGAEVALYRLGIPMKEVIAVEKCKYSRAILKDWWDETQTGRLTQVEDVRSHDYIVKLVRDMGGVDVVIGGSPWNELDSKGLEGDLSSLFFEYVRILKSVRAICRQQ